MLLHGTRLWREGSACPLQGLRLTVDRDVTSIEPLQSQAPQNQPEVQEGDCEMTRMVPRWVATRAVFSFALEMDVSGRFPCSLCRPCWRLPPSQGSSLWSWRSSCCRARHQAFSPWRNMLSLGCSGWGALSGKAAPADPRSVTRPIKQPFKRPVQDSCGPSLRYK